MRGNREKAREDYRKAIAEHSALALGYVASVSYTHLDVYKRQVSLLTALPALAYASSAPPQWEIANKLVRVKLYLPNAVSGSYRGTRFDWSGVIADLQYAGHSYYGPWFTQTDPKVPDFIYQGAEIVAGPCSAITGPVEEFTPALGFDEAKAGGTFLKLGVGILRKPDDAPYSAYRLYEIVDGGKWSTKKSACLLYTSRCV